MGALDGEMAKNQFGLFANVNASAKNASAGNPCAMKSRCAASTIAGAPQA
jgi:hypothetical protein